MPGREIIAIGVSAGGVEALSAWNDRARDLWGSRMDEVEGRNFLNMDFGVPALRQRDPIRACAESHTGNGELTVPAVNRNGRSIQPRVTRSPLHGMDGATDGVILLMKDVPDAGSEVRDG